MNVGIGKSFVGAIVCVIALGLTGAVMVSGAAHLRPASTFRTTNLIVDDTSEVNQAMVMAGNGNPNGIVTASKGSMWMDKTTPSIWQNLDGATTWQQVGSSLNTNHLEMIGDSQTYGNGDTDHLFDKQLIPPYVPVTMNALIGAGIPFTPQHTVADQALQPFGPAGFANMGYELSIGRHLNAAGRPSTKIGKFACQGADLTRYLPSGGDLWPLLIAYLDARVADWGVIGTLYWDIGSNDAANAVPAANWSANFTTVMSALRQRYGNMLVIYRQISPEIALSSHPYVDIVRAQQVLYAGGDPNSIMVNTDDVPLSTDHLHYDANGYELVGWRIAQALIAALGPAAGVYETGEPVYVGAGYQANGGGALSPVEFPIPQVPSYFDVLVVATGLVASAGPATLSEPAGFVSVGSVTSTFSGLEQNLTIFYRRATARSRGTPTVADNNDFNAARIFTFRQPVTISGSPFDTAGSFSANNTFGTAISATGDTTLSDDDLVATFTGDFAGSSLVGTSGWANSTLTGVALTEENVMEEPSANAEIITLTLGTKAISGAFGATTATSSASIIGAFAALSIKP